MELKACPFKKGDTIKLISYGLDNCYLWLQRYDMEIGSIAYVDNVYVHELALSYKGRTIYAHDSLFEKSVPKRIKLFDGRTVLR